MIITTQGLGFIAIPKTGSTTVETVLHENELVSCRNSAKHIDYQCVEQYIEPMLEALRKDPVHFFAVVRNPAERLFSWHRYRQRPSIKNRKRSTADISFSDFCQRVLDNKSEDGPFYIRSQADFIKAKTGEFGVKTLLKLESLNITLPKLLEIFSISVDEPNLHLNKSRSKNGDALTDDLRRTINSSAMFREDYDLHQSALSTPQEVEMVIDQWRAASRPNAGPSAGMNEKTVHKNAIGKPLAAAPMGNDRG